MLTLTTLLWKGCWPARVDLAYEPGSARPLPAAGIHGLTYCVDVVDERLTDDPLRVGQRRGPLFFRPSVRARTLLPSLLPGRRSLEPAREPR